MSRFAAGLSQHPDPAAAVGEAAGQVLDGLDGEHPDLLLCFASSHFRAGLDEVGSALRTLLRPGVLLATASESVIGGSHEIEGDPAVSLWAARLHGARLTPLALTQTQGPDAITITGWPDLDHEPGALLLLADPYTFPTDAFLAGLDAGRREAGKPPIVVLGGLAWGADRPGATRLVVNDHVTAQGAVGVLLDGVRMEAVVSQGCRPVGSPYTVTEADRSFVVTLGGTPALERLRALAGTVSEADRELLRQGVHLGIVVDEQRVEFTRGDFLVRNVLGADTTTGALAVGDRVQIGQTVQFHVRDAAAADEDLRGLLAGKTAAGALVFTCNGRGRHLFGEPDHDAGVVASVLGPIPAAGMFCAGEIGPVGPRNFLHGFTASLALFE